MKLLHPTNSLRLTAFGISVPKGITNQWVVDCKQVGSGAKAIAYLGRYLYRGVLQEKDILYCDEQHVRFRYINSKTKKWKRELSLVWNFYAYYYDIFLPKDFDGHVILDSCIPIANNKSPCCRYCWECAHKPSASRPDPVWFVLVVAESNGSCKPESDRGHAQMWRHNLRQMWFRKPRRQWCKPRDLRWLHRRTTGVCACLKTDKNK